MRARRASRPGRDREPRFVLVGIAAELSLRPLGEALRRRGLAVSVVDLGREAAGPSCVPDGDGPVVAVTSQHLAMTGDVYDAHTGLTSHYVAPQALRQRLGADVLVYVPHDLSEPVLPTEVDLLQTVDLYVAPDGDGWWAGAHVPVVTSGWVGTAWWDAEALAQAPLDQGVLFLTQVQWLMSVGGAPFVLRSLRSTLETGVAVKLPVWPGLEPLADGLAAAGIPLVDPQLPAVGVAWSTPLVVTNAPSSVLAEAALAGHRPVCVLPGDAPVEFAGQLSMLDVAVCDDGGFAAARTRAGRVRPPGSRFDLELFLSSVDAALGGGRP